MTVCGHDQVCSVCYVRMRTLLRAFTCPMCKTELENVVCPKGKLKSHSSYQVDGSEHLSGYVYNHRARMFFPPSHYKQHIETLWQCRCRQCGTLKRDVKALKAHLLQDHNTLMCGLCIEHKQAFPAEQKCYSQAEYEKHLRDGDGDGSEGHPNCEFCRKRYYDRTALFTHLTKDHYSCFICDRAEVKYKYYHDYNALDRHFRRDHFACRDKHCVEQRFVVFPSEIELHSHNMSYHPNINIARSFPVHFGSGNRQHGRQGSCGGNGEESTRMNELAQDVVQDFMGEWQVEVTDLGASGRGGEDGGGTRPLAAAAVTQPLRTDATDRRLLDDFPELKVSGDGDYAEAAGVVPGSGGRRGKGSIHDVSASMAQASLGVGSGIDAGGFGMGSSIRIKVDKRLGRKSKSSGSLRSEGDAHSSTNGAIHAPASGKSVPRTSSHNHMGWQGSATTGSVGNGAVNDWNDNAFPVAKAEISPTVGQVGVGAKKMSKAAPRSDWGMAMASAGINQPPKHQKKSSISLARPITSKAKLSGSVHGNKSTHRSNSSVTSNADVFGSFGAASVLTSSATSVGPTVPMARPGAAHKPDSSWISIGGASGRTSSLTASTFVSDTSYPGLPTPTGSVQTQWGASATSGSGQDSVTSTVIPDTDLPVTIPKASKQKKKKAKEKDDLKSLAFGGSFKR